MPRHMIDDAGLEPAVETATGETYNGNTVYKQTFDSAILGTHTGDLVVVTGVLDLVRAYGNATQIINRVAIPFDDGTNKARMNLATGGNLSITMSADFANQAYRIVAEYTK